MTALSFAQERLWFLHRLDPADTTYHICTVRRLRGPLDADALEAGFTDVVARHESLRTRFPDTDGEPYAVVKATGPTLERLDATTDAAELVAERTGRPFVIGAAPPLRATLIRLADDDHILCVVLHHLIGDGWSLGVLTSDLAECYAARRDDGTPTLPPLAMRYADHAEAQRKALSDVDFWTERLAGTPVLALPTDRPRPPRRSSHAGEVLFRLRPELGTALAKLARAQRCTLFMVLLSAYQVLLARHSGQDDIVVGSPTAGRDDPDLEPVVGLFASTLVLRGDLTGDPSFTELLRRTRTTISESFSHSEVPLERLLSTLDIERDLSRTPLFQTLLTLHTAAAGYGEQEDFAGLSSEPFHPGSLRVKGDLTLDLWPRPEGMLGSLLYSTELFDHDTMAALAARFEVLLEAIVAAPETPIQALRLLPDAELALLEKWNDTAGEVPASTVDELVAQAAAAHPDRTAVVCGDTRWTYRELVDRAARVAGRLRAEGIGPGDVVGVFPGRGAEMVAALLGVLRSGAAYLPLDPDYPAERIAFVLADSGTRVVLTDTPDRLPTSVRALPLAPDGEPAAGVTGPHAYLLYTSGSTGRPKGVQVPHTALTNFLTAMRGLFGDGHIWLASTSLSFDISGLELYLPLITGGHIVVADQQTARDGAALATLISEAGVTHVQATPSGWSMLLAAGVQTGLTALVGGEALPLSLARELRARVDRLVNLYGPTETTIWSTAWEVPPDPETVRIGHPILNTEVSVRHGEEPAPIGTPGELVIGGAGVASGYHNRPHETAFEGGRYRTGDQVRWHPDGTLEFLGRADGQIKLRGHRIELGEIETVLSGHHRVAVAVHDERLVAYATGDTDGLLERAAELLPAYMIPAVVVPLDALPLTPNGKLDRAALPAPGRTAPGVGGPPRTAAERRVAAVFAEVLGVPEVGAGDDFFALGGHSLLAVKATARLGVPVHALFASPTVAGLAGASGPDVASPAPRPPGTPPRLSPAQERLWFLQRLDPDDASYTMFIVRRLTGRLDVDAFRRAFSALVERHETLRTGFPDRAGRPEPTLFPGSPTVELVAASEQDAQELAAERTNAAFDLATPPVRAALLELADDDHVLCLTLHHIIADGWSLGVLLDDLSALYQAEPATLPPLPVQFGDLVHDDADETYWRNRLADPPVLDLPTDRPRRANSRRAGAFHPFRLPGDVVDGLERVARAEGATLFMILVAAYQVLLARHTGQTDILIGTPAAGRDHPDLEPMVGYLSRTLVLRGDLGGDPGFATVLRATRQDVLDALAHPDIPFERLGLDRDLTRTPLFQTMAILHSQDTDGPARDSLGDLGMRFFPDGYRQAKFELTLEAWREPDHLSAVFGYDRDLFDPATIAALTERFTTLLAGIVATPDAPLSALPVLTADDYTVLAELGGSLENPYTTLVPELIEHHDRIALSCEDTSITYGELHARVGRLATSLRRQGVTAETVVGVPLGRSIDAVVAMLAVWHAGGAYLPLDPDLPRARRAELIADSGAVVPDLSPDEEPCPRFPNDPENAAYVLYTSGSTGVPKGVVVEHGNLAARVGWMRDAYALGPGDRIVQLAPLGFDTHVEELYPALAAGAAVVILPDGGAALPELLALRDDITVLDLPTALFHRLTGLLDEIAWPPGLRLVILGGEQVQAAAVARWQRRFPDVRLVNTYGPTETTVIATVTDLDDTDPPPIGRPLPGTLARIMDHDVLVPPGAPGELIIGGAGVARGYVAGALGKFFAEDDVRYYRTGDRVRWRDGQLEFLGRLDDQLKVRGFRVEPAEVERQLLARPGVRQAAVTARDEALVAYVAGTADHAVLAASLAEVLPSHLVPTRWVSVEELPLTRSGKVDLAALPDPDPLSHQDFRAPETDAEELVASVWTEVLGVTRVGVGDDFFALGGHSLLAVRVAARLRTAIGADVPIRTLFTRRTLGELAVAVEELLLAELDGLSDEEALRLLEAEETQ